MKKLLVLLLFVLPAAGFSQSYTQDQLRQVLDSVSRTYSGYNNKVQLNVAGIQLYELLNSIALENNLNISVDPGFNQMVSYNFYDAQVKDVLLFLYENFEVEYKFVGSILSVKKRLPPPAQPPAVTPPRKINANYNAENEFLSVDLKNDTLASVVQTLTTLTGKNVVIAPDIKDRIVSAYFLNRPFDQVFNMIAKANGLESEKDDQGIYYLFQTVKQPGTQTGQQGFKPSVGGEQNGIRMTRNAYGSLDIVANNAEIGDLIREAGNQLGAYYFFYNKPEGRASFEMNNVTYDQLLEKLLNGTKYHFREENRVYLIGEIKTEGIRSTELIRMENRTIELVKNSIPKELTTDLEINEFPELNGLVVSGSGRKIAELRAYLSSIDIVVPMIQIDVMILLSRKTSSVKSGIKVGLKPQPTTSTGTFDQNGLDIAAGASTLNRILDAINGFGIVNLGNVTDNFYLNLQLLESNDIVDIESTPKITTLNGHLATVSIGETTYYQEVQVDVQNSVVNQGVLSSRTWKALDANLTVKLTPFVSSDDNVTLTITVTQADFGGKIDPSAPPNISKQTFESLVRVKNGEVVLLGGLDKKKSDNAGSGIPLLSRIPVIRWFFSSREKSKEKSKLHILIRPTVTY